MIDVPAVIEDRIVQIEKNSLWQLTVHNIFIGVGAQANPATIPEVSRVLLRKSQCLEAPPGLCELCGRSDDTSGVIIAAKEMLASNGLGVRQQMKLEACG